MVETVGEGKEVDTLVDRQYPNRKRQKTIIYDPRFQEKRYEDDA